jgi:uncharacterized integral membrane protein
VNVLRQLLLLPLLAPLLAVLLVGAVNPRPAVNLRLLIWSSPALPLGVWMMLTAGGGALLSALGTGLALRAPGPGLQRQVRRQAGSGRAPEPWEAAAPPSGAAPPPFNAAVGAGPSRAAGEPSPTVEVPYRVIRKGRPGPARQNREPVSAATAAAPTVAAPTTAAATVGGGADGWDQPLSDDW